MTVKQLREALAGKPEHALVVLSCDSEGNEGSPLASVEDGIYQADTAWYGQIINEDEDEDGEQAVILYPIK